jgi:hypothetical protein
VLEIAHSHEHFTMGVRSHSIGKYRGNRFTMKDRARHPNSRPRSRTDSPKLRQLHAENRQIPDLRLRLGPFLRQWLEEVARPRLRATTLKSYREIVQYRRDDLHPHAVPIAFSSASRMRSSPYSNSSP